MISLRLPKLTIRLLIPFFIVLFLVLGIVAYLLYSPYILSSLEIKSSVEGYINENKVSVKFHLTEEEKADALAFSNSLGTDSKWLEGFSFEIDEPSTQKISKFFPIKTVIDFSPKEVKLENNKIPKLRSALSKTTFEFATASSKIKLNQKSSSEFDLEINDPKPLIEYATASAQIYLTEKFANLFHISDKISKISLSVDGKNLTGEIILK